MIGYWGSYQFANNAIVVASEVKTMMNSGGQPYAHQYTFKVKGYLGAAGDTQATITQKMSALHTALQRPYQNFIFRQDSGSPSATFLLNNTSVTGAVVIDGPNFAESRGAEYSSQREFDFTVRAEYALTGTANLLLNFSERLSFHGTGPRFVVKEAVIGLPQKQQVREHTVSYATQSGSAEGYTKYPNVPPPLWPTDLTEAPHIEYTSPDRMGRAYQCWRVSWNYSFASALPLVGRPNLWLS